MHAASVLEPELERVEAPAAHRHAKTGAVVRILEREEDGLPAILPLELGDLALDPERRQPCQPVGNATVESGDRVDLPIAVLQRLDLHEPSLAPHHAAARSSAGVLEQDLGGCLVVAALVDELDRAVQGILALPEARA